MPKKKKKSQKKPLKKKKKLKKRSYKKRRVIKKIQDHLNIKDPKNISRKLEKKELTETKDDMEKINCKKCNDLRWISLKNDNFKYEIGRASCRERV